MEESRSETELLKNLCAILIKEVNHLKQYVAHKNWCTKIRSGQNCNCGLDDLEPLSRLENGENIH